MRIDRRAVPDLEKLTRASDCHADHGASRPRPARVGVLITVGARRYGFCKRVMQRGASMNGSRKISPSCLQLWLRDRIHLTALTGALLAGCASSAGAPGALDGGTDAIDAIDTTTGPDQRADDSATDRATDQAEGHSDASTDADAGVNADADGPALFAAVQAIFDARCIVCHDAQRQGLPTYPMLPLTAGASYAALVGHPADETCGGTRVVPGDSARSYLIHKLSDAPPCEGLRMPRGFEVLTPPPLDEPTMAIIRRWIDAGAPPP